jgi:hypothetical protein
MHNSEARAQELLMSPAKISHRQALAYSRPVRHQRLLAFLGSFSTIGKVSKLEFGRRPNVREAWLWGHTLI